MTRRMTIEHKPEPQELEFVMGYAHLAPIHMVAMKHTANDDGSYGVLYEGETIVRDGLKITDMLKMFAEDIPRCTMLFIIHPVKQQPGWVTTTEIVLSP